MPGPKSLFPEEWKEYMNDERAKSKSCRNCVHFRVAVEYEPIIYARKWCEAGRWPVTALWCKWFKRKPNK